MSEVAYENLRKILPEAVEEHLDKPLTEEEKQAVRTQEDHGIVHSAKMLEYDSLADFMRHQNNFYVHFADSHSRSFSQIYRTRRAFQRFEITNPELVAKLFGKVEQLTPFTDEQWEDLYQAYKEMSLLVDENDVGVIDEDGEVNSWFLCS